MREALAICKISAEAAIDAVLTAPDVTAQINKLNEAYAQASQDERHIFVVALIARLVVIHTIYGAKT